MWVTVQIALKMQINAQHHCEIALKLRKTKQLSDTPVENLDNNEEM